MTTSVVYDLDLKARIGEVLSRWPVAGLAVGVVRHGSPAWFHGHGVADVAAGTPIDQDTGFRIASVTKTITAIAVMQLREQGLVDLDAPASAYLNAYRLVPARPGFRPATLRHLLTHTAGVRAVREPSDLLRPALGWGTRAGRPVPSLAGYYRGGLHIDAEPGTKWAYSNHGFATLGQIVEDVSGVPFGRRIPGMGLGFFRGQAGAHPTVSHDGIWPGFHSALVLAPGQGTGVVAFANTGQFSPLAAAGPVASAVLRSILGLPGDAVRTGVPEQPRAWGELCGWYTLGPGVLTDPQPRMFGGVQVSVRHDHLTLRGQIPVPAVRRGLRLYPDGDDPYAFRINLPGFGSGTSSVVFSRDPSGHVTAMHLGVQPLSFYKRPAARNRGPWAAGALAAGAVALAAGHRHRARRAVAIKGGRA